jgi:hypothetical protein
MTDFLDFSEQLLSTTTEAIEYSKEYLASRKQAAHCFNQLQVLIFKAGLHRTKKSPENKIIELLSDPVYGQEATKLNEEMTEQEANYKGLELVIKANIAHSSALQSVMKQQTQGEISESMRNKYIL